MSELELGRVRGAGGGAPLRLPTRALLRHMMALGSSGSGKTVLSKVVVEEIVRAGIPALCLDPQGDLCSLALAAEDPEALAERGLDPATARAFAERCDVVIFTPASTKGLRFVERPAEHASDVRDLDGEVRFTRMPPAGLRFDEQDWNARRAEAEVREVDWE
jgi:DNA helicase HerA-like ATPase